MNINDRIVSTTAETHPYAVAIPPHLRSGPLGTRHAIPAVGQTREQVRQQEGDFRRRAGSPRR